MNVIRSQFNPLVSPKDVKPCDSSFEVIGTFNAGSIDYNGKTVLLLRVAEKPVSIDSNKVCYPEYNEVIGRVEVKALNRNDPFYDFSDPRVIKDKNGKNFLTSISHIRYAESSDGIHFKIDDKPLVTAYDKYTAYGVEDARITRIDDCFYINFSAASQYGIITRLISTKDFRGFNDLGNIFHPDNKDITIFPKKIKGLYYALHRPSTSEYGKPNIWIASSPDLQHWGNHKLLAKTGDTSWDSGRIGASCVPLLTEKGWLEIYHGATEDNCYSLGAMLLGEDDPTFLVAKSHIPLLVPEASYERFGFMKNVVFSCGLVERDGVLGIYYGAADQTICLACVSLKEVLASLD